MLWPFYFKAACQNYNILEMDNYEKTPEQNFSCVEFQIFPKDYHTWGCSVFILEHPLQGGPAGLPKWETRTRNGVYLGQSPLPAGSLDLALNTRTGHVHPQYHVVFDNTFSTVEHMRNVTVP